MRGGRRSFDRISPSFLQLRAGDDDDGMVGTGEGRLFPLC